jgi:hypothetical protein
MESPSLDQLHILPTPLRIRSSPDAAQLLAGAPEEHQDPGKNIRDERSSQAGHTVFHGSRPARSETVKETWPGRSPLPFAPGCSARLETVRQLFLRLSCATATVSWGCVLTVLGLSGRMYGRLHGIAVPSYW